MIKFINYFFQSILIYIFFLIGRLIGLKMSRKLFSILFCKIGPLIRSKKVIDKNINIFSQNINEIEKKNIINGMWKNYGMTFIEYILEKITNI